MSNRTLHFNRKLRKAEKLSKLTTLLFVLLATSLQSKAIIFTIGTGTNNNTESGITPFTTGYEDSRVQYIYLASELLSAGAGPGNIQSIGFNFTSLGDPNPTGVNIKIGTTTASTLSTLLPGLTVVYSASSIAPVIGWNTYTFNTSFAWNGSDNIVIEVCMDNTNWDVNYGVQATDLGPGNTRTFGYYDDGVTGCLMTSGGTATATERQFRPNCQFDMISSTTCTGKPVAGTAAASSGDTICANFAFSLGTSGGAFASGLSYDWQYDNGGGWQSSGIATQNYTVSGGITVSTNYRLVVSCSATGTTDTSNIVAITVEPISTPPWLYNVETQNSTTNSTITNDCWASSPSGTTAAFRWNVGSGTTNTLNTGPNGAFSGNKYFYTEANQGILGDSARLMLPLFDISTATAPMLTFYYHMYGNQMGKLIVQANNGSGWVSLDSLVGQQQTASSSAWLQKTIDLSGVVAANLQLRFVGIKGSGSRGDMSIDDIAVTSTPLAIRLDKFNAVNSSTINKLEWTTLSEERSDRFELERSADGSNFNRIYEIQANGSPGQYNYIDREPFAGRNFYRLRLLEANGNTTYSKTVMAFVNRRDFEIQAFPNPVSHKLTVQLNSLPGTDALLQLTDITGKVIYSLKMTGSVQHLDMTGLASGIYLVRYADMNNTRTIRVNKQ